MPHRNRRSLITTLTACAIVAMGFGARATRLTADEIRLTNGKKLSGTVLGKDAESVVIRVPRDRVAAVNGKPLPAPVKEGRDAPPFTAVDLQGTTHTLAEARGQPVLLQFWASWCPHCRSDLAMLKTLAQRYQGDHGLRILTISIDQDLEALRAFAAAEQLTYPIIPVVGPSISPEQAALPDRYEMQGVPAYYLIDANGRIVKTISGSVSEGGKNLDDVIQGLLSSRTASTSTTP
jgi:peroxiredoxin